MVGTEVKILKIHLYIAFVLIRQKIMFWSFLIKLQKNFLEFYLLLIGFFFSTKKINKQNFDKVHFSPNNYF